MSELRTISRHAGTVLVGQLAVMSFGVADTMIAGRYSPHALAVLSLASSIYISIYVALNGMLQALLPVWAELHGANRPARNWPLRATSPVHRLAGAAALGMAGLWFPDPVAVLDRSAPERTVARCRAYLRILAVALVPSLLFRMYSTLNQSLGYPRLVTWLQAGALLVKIPLSVVLTFGMGDQAGMGVVGCAWATLAVNTLMMLTGPLAAENPRHLPPLPTVAMARKSAMARHPAFFAHGRAGGPVHHGGSHLFHADGLVHRPSGLGRLGQPPNCRQLGGRAVHGALGFGHRQQCANRLLVGRR
jgi:Na+-driven multidrug efflux pump